jgi:hypothetical protein
MSELLAKLVHVYPEGISLPGAFAVLGQFLHDVFASSGGAQCLFVSHNLHEVRCFFVSSALEGQET